MDSNPKYIILDSCIIEYILNRYISPHILKLLLEWKDNLGIAICEISYTELLDGAHIRKENDLLKILNGFPRFVTRIDEQVAAGQLGSLYLQEDQRHKAISLGDKIIGATSILNNTVVVTANVIDFPHPFFINLSTQIIKYKKESIEKTISIAALYPNYSFITNKFNSRN